MESYEAVGCIPSESVESFEPACRSTYQAVGDMSMTLGPQSLQTVEEVIDDTSEWPSNMMRLQTPICKESGQIPCATAQSKRPYAGGNQGQLRWLALTPLPLSKDTADSNNSNFSNGSAEDERASCLKLASPGLKKQQSVLFTDAASEPEAVLERGKTLASTGSKLMSGSDWEISSSSRHTDPRATRNFQSLLGSVVTNLQELTVSIHNLREWHQTEQNGQAPLYHVASSMSGHDVASLLNRLSSALPAGPLSRAISRKSLRSAPSHESSILGGTSYHVHGNRSPMLTTHRSSTMHIVKSVKSTVSRRTSYQSGKPAMEPMNFFLREAWLEFDTLDLFDQQQVVVSGTVKSGSKGSMFRRHLKSSSSAVSGLNRSQHNSSSFRMKDNFSSDWMLHPQSLIKFLWDSLCLIALLYDMFVIPLQAFNMNEVDFFREAEWVITVLWTTDIFVTLTSGYVKGAYVVMNRRQSCSHYVRTWMLFDLILVVLDWYARLSDGNFIGLGNFFRFRCFWSVRSARAARLGKVTNLVRRVEDNLGKSGYSNLILLGWGMLKLTLTLLIVVHFVTCIWFAIGESDPDGWTSYYNGGVVGGHRDRFFWYFASSRWTLAQINGRTDIDEKRNLLELWYTCIVAVLFAALFMSIFVSSITSTMVELNAAAEMETTTGRVLNEYLTSFAVPKVLVDAARRYIRESKYMEAEDSEVKLLASLPKQLAGDLVFAMHQPTMARNAFFAEIHDIFPRVMRQLCSSVISNVQVHKWEMVYDLYDPCSRMLFIEKGRLVYANDLDADNEIWVPNYADPDSHPPPGVDLNRGAWMSEAALWMEWVNHGRCIASARSTLLEIAADKFAGAIREYRDLHSKTCTYARKFLDVLQTQEVMSDIFVVELTYQTDRGSQISHYVSSETKTTHTTGDRSGRLPGSLSDFASQFSPKMPSRVSRLFTA